MTLDMVQAIPFKNFCYKQGKTWSEETIWLKGGFKREGSEEITTGDIFEAHKVLGCSLEEIYKLYIEWFNYTLRPYEKKRTFVSVEEYKEVNQ
jgi:hypothetical protein